MRRAARDARSAEYSEARRLAPSAPIRAALPVSAASSSMARAHAPGSPWGTAIQPRPATVGGESAGGNVTGGKPKGGTSRFFHLLTAQIAAGPFRPAGPERAAKSRDVAACLEGMLSAVARLQLRPRLCLPDRGFSAYARWKSRQSAG